MVCECLKEACGSFREVCGGLRGFKGMEQLPFSLYLVHLLKRTHPYKCAQALPKFHV